jgi:xanthosine utilization system XapX-like protein
VSAAAASFIAGLLLGIVLALFVIEAPAALSIHYDLIYQGQAKFRDV